VGSARVGQTLIAPVAFPIVDLLFAQCKSGIRTSGLKPLVLSQLSLVYFHTGKLSALLASGTAAEAKAMALAKMTICMLAD